MNCCSVGAKVVASQNGKRLEMVEVEMSELTPKYVQKSVYGK